MRRWRYGCFGLDGAGRDQGARPQADWRTIHRELRRKGVTLQLLWEEPRAELSSCGAVLALMVAVELATASAC